MKKVFIFVNALLSYMAVFAQGWVGSGTNTLYPVDNSLSLTPINIGVGTSSPTAQFHTTGTVRLSGITKNNLFNHIMVQDIDGYVAWRDVSTFGVGNAWILTGNGATDPANNFLGTTDNNRLVFRTSNTEKMTVLTNGNVGIGLNAPQRLLHVYSNGGDDQAAISGQSPSLRFFEGSNVFSSTIRKCGRIGLATGATDFVSTSVPGDFIIQSLDTAASLIFGTSQSSNGLERMRITAYGYVGIGTTAPTARFHINCANQTFPVNPPSHIRFENIETITDAHYLVIDDEGYVYRLSAEGKPGKDLSAMEDKIRSLENEIRELRALVQSMNSPAAGTNLFRIYPNPASNFLVVEVNPQKNLTRSAIVSDVNGKAVTGRQSFTNSVEIPLSRVAAGTYFVTIYSADNRVLETQRVVVAR